MNRPWIKFAVSLILNVLSFSPARADTELDAQGLPLWELGGGAGTLTAPAYLGSKVYRSYVAPWPYFIYRGETLHADREGVGLTLLRDERLKLDFSFSGALPVDSTGTARAGMPDLPLVVEGGTVLKVRLADSEDQRLSLRLPLRYGTGVNGQGLHGVGWIADPTLRLGQKLHVMGQSLDWGLDLSLKFQDASFNNFYYQVTPGQATAARPAYTSSGGYSGATLNTGLLARRGNWVFAGFVGFSDISHARFANSPLVQQTGNLYGGVALFYVFRQSDEQVPRRHGAEAGKASE